MYECVLGGVDWVVLLVLELWVLFEDWGVQWFVLCCVVLVGLGMFVVLMLVVCVCCYMVGKSNLMCNLLAC